MSEEMDKEVKLEKLRADLYHKELERDAKKGKPEYKIICIYLEALQKQIAELEAGIK